MTQAILHPVRLEVARPRKGRPGYAFVDGYEIETPTGSRIQPYMRKNEAIAFCKAQGWTYRKAD